MDFSVGDIVSELEARGCFTGMKETAVRRMSEFTSRRAEKAGGNELKNEKKEVSEDPWKDAHLGPLGYLPLIRTSQDGLALLAEQRSREEKKRRGEEAKKKKEMKVKEAEILAEAMQIQPGKGVEKPRIKATTDAGGSKPEKQR